MVHFDLLCHLNCSVVFPETVVHFRLGRGVQEDDGPGHDGGRRLGHPGHAHGVGHLRLADALQVLALPVPTHPPGKLALLGQLDRD